MVAKTMVTPEEYLSTAFEGTDPEYVDGEVVERAMPDLIHGEVQTKL
ncbi:MAG: hypothetical protein JNL98_24785, partial [Bryobacterales bacterium]|nr:hypothetical protein [Bryobacterales bacterium]